MDEEIRRLEFQYHTTNDPDALRSLDIARERAGLPISLESLDERKQAITAWIQRNFRDSLLYSLNNYMRKYSNVVDHLRWRFDDVDDPAWISSMNILFNSDIRTALEPDADDLSLEGPLVLSDLLEYDPEDDINKDLLKAIATWPNKVLIQASCKDVEKLLDLFRSFTREFIVLFDLPHTMPLHIIYTNQNQLLTLNRAQFNEYSKSFRAW